MKEKSKINKTFLKEYFHLVKIRILNIMINQNISIYITYQAVKNHHQILLKIIKILLNNKKNLKNKKLK
jgi:hypothetical protein